MTENEIDPQKKYKKICWRYGVQTDGFAGSKITRRVKIVVEDGGSWLFNYIYYQESDLQNGLCNFEERNILKMLLYVEF